MFLKNPKTVGALFPSSRSLTGAMIREGGDLHKSKLIVELGVGTGVLTGHLAEQLPKTCDFFALELNPVFAQQVQEALPHLTIYEDSAAHINDYLERHHASHVDTIYSGIPWANIPPSVQLDILKSIHESLRPGGKFITFAYTHSYYFRTASNFRDLLEERFSSLEVSPIVWKNIPPAVIYTCVK